MRAHGLCRAPAWPGCVFSCGGQGTVMLFDVRARSAEHIMSFTSGRSIINSISADPTGGYSLAVSGSGPFVNIFDVRMAREADEAPRLRTLVVADADPTAEPTCIEYNWNGTSVVATLNDDYAYLLADRDDTAAAVTLRRYTGARNSETVKSIAFLGDRSQYIVSGSDCGNAMVWETKSAELASVLRHADRYVINAIAPHPSGYPLLATAGIEDNVKLWCPDLDQPRFTIDPELESVLSRNVPRSMSSSSMPSLYEQMFEFLSATDFDVNLLQTLLDQEDNEDEDEAGVEGEAGDEDEVDDSSSGGAGGDGASSDYSEEYVDPRTLPGSGSENR
ncbi:WDR42C protein [Thecamonas trahens ATCC 50062]|uniref:WDR42C protein n=1 Tax=Thecamonas trahens ATCC 50062 TaxID=461836 RepID=A0A0L0DIQ6_THETB|nr:WDR42C protein [Thecamonas trahens ATCC 50062]KNC52075.1 WDR42C protein [Thecamonas trahens ATCC 50062]|eukprot:XP_013762080.1 WDR42C protein [Thecamonas trahens ATCC 50062]